MTAGSDPPATSKDGSAPRNTSVPESQKDDPADIDDFGLPRRPASRTPRPLSSDSSDDDDDAAFHDAEDVVTSSTSTPPKEQIQSTEHPAEHQRRSAEIERGNGANDPEVTHSLNAEITNGASVAEKASSSQSLAAEEHSGSKDESSPTARVETQRAGEDKPSSPVSEAGVAKPKDQSTPSSPSEPKRFPSIKKEKRSSAAVVSEWSHQALVVKDEESEPEEEVEWQAMPALGEMDYYDDRGRLVAKGAREEDPGKTGYSAMGFSSRGYTKLQLDEDAHSTTSMDDDTNYLFKKDEKPKAAEAEAEADDDDDDDYDDDLGRDAATQLENTKDLLTEGQRIAYVGVVRLTIYKMLKALDDVERTKGTKKDLVKALESMEIWGQQMMVRLFAHMEIDTAEQVMIEQLAEHGVTPHDLVPPLMQHARIKNPNSERKSGEKSDDHPGETVDNRTKDELDHKSSTEDEGLNPANVKAGEEVPEVQETLPTTDKVDLDLRWTVLCDLFLVLISDGSYDSRSRRLLERVASSMQVTWQQICRFERRIIDALEMQEAELRESLDETDNLDKRRKAGLKRKYITMGLVTVGGAAVIGLSAGLLAPLIGAGLAAGFTTVGIGGTTAFLTGVGGAAIVTSIGVTTGGTIALRASDRRFGHVKTFEYRPLHNNKRLNLILTVSGWMTGKVDDVRLPFSTVDPIMGDIYSLLWEPDMLRSTGDTINILATEALTQTIQQVLGSTLLIGLMSAIQLPIILTKLAYLIDNPWNVSLDRANAAGLILADSLIQRHLGQRPITLVGFSLGARLIFSCLKELANRGAYGIVQNVYLFGAPITAKRDEYLRARSVIAGRFVNGYASNDWILGYLFRATAGGLGRVAGLAAVENIPGMENKDVGEFVNGHMAYRAAMPRLLREVGWEVESDEFSEIEDPDPDNHEARQRELIREIDEARKQAEKEPERKRFGFFKRGKPAGKLDWESYKAGASGHASSPSNGDESKSGPGEPNVLFDIDAIRRELASEYVEVRELDSTMPAMQIVTTGKDGEKQTEFLRLPQNVNLSADELSRMKLPPRPDEDGQGVIPMPALPARTSSLRPSPRQSPGQSPRHSPAPSSQPSPRRIPSPEPEDYGFGQPRELVSTLPPLNITPSISQGGFDSDVSRPALKTHATEPSPSSWSKHQSLPSNNITPPVDPYNIEHNAWAEDGLGKEKDIKMTFE
ncbi:uncharacterized protein HMPREF1541_04197 [Cyphellophora europaea CBS 101466]|uniref:DUF726 domain-containing protein n=1 Tax=Cyphellophora europaea (strain CBS 101466) TaxID=1220924 RepID=W2S0K0_CYPE1|nr:uncharacterized protein HMPREF1541_04197 [Cyphellophora europaea CBS 101466]ETN42256.1 hypothetical protein HMPREF1541_04197 [Cyphellophora europaea CBS 101466]